MRRFYTHGKARKLANSPLSKYREKKKFYLNLHSVFSLYVTMCFGKDIW